MDMSINMIAAAFNKTVVGTGTLVDAVDSSAHTKYTIATTTGASSDVVNGEAGGGRLYFGKPITLQLKYAVSNNTTINYRMGCGQALMQNAIGTNSMLGFEGCTGTNALNRVFSADGSWSAEDMGNMVPTGSIPFGLRIDYYPSSKIVATDGDGTTIIKTGNLPLVGNATNADATFRFGVKTLAASTRWIKLYAMRLVGSSYDSTAGIKGWV